MSKSKAGKRQGGIFQRLGNFIAGTPPPSETEAYIANNGVQPSGWNNQYNNVKLEGAVVVDGKFCSSPAEIKAANAKKYGPDGYGP